jgi:hypothetical protein
MQIKIIKTIVILQRRHPVTILNWFTQIYTQLIYYISLSYHCLLSFMMAFFLFRPPIFPIEMTGLNRGVANSRGGYASRQIDE